jgi:predicted alpha/beta-hydrolase family hydrolase
MNILGLPGKNDSTGPWMREILAAISSQGDIVETQYYDAWKKPGAEIDEKLEIAIAEKFSPSLIVAKSMGAIITILGVSLRKVMPIECVLIGVPVNSLLQEERSILSAWPDAGIRTLFIQQSSDMTGSYNQLVDLVPSSEDITLAEIEGSDHAYSNTNEIARIIRNWKIGVSN